MVGGHTERDVYVTWVLWVIGMSEASIATVVMKRRKQISGIVTRSPYANRSRLTDDERRAALSDLLAIRRAPDGRHVDRGLLDRVPLKIIPLRSSQMKRSRP